MLNYEKWKKLNETLGPTTLGLSNPQSLGITGARFQNLNNGDEVNEMMDMEEEDMEDDEEDMEEDDMEDHDSMSHKHSVVKDDMEEDEEEDMEEDEEEDMEEDDMEDEEEDMEEDDMEEDDMEEDDMEEDDMEEDDMEEEEEDMEEDDMEEDDTEDEEEDMEEDEMEDEDTYSMPAEDSMEESAKKQKLAEAAWWKSVNGMIGISGPINEAKEDKPKLVGKVATAVTKFETFLTPEDVKKLNRTMAIGLIIELLNYIEMNNDNMNPSNLRSILLAAADKYSKKNKLPKE